MPAIAIDTSQLTFPLVSVPGSGRGFVDGSADPPPELRLPAGTGYRLALADGTRSGLAFDVREDGTLDFAAEDDAFLAGRGGRRLTVRGLPVTVDARALALPLALDLPGAAPLPGDRVHTLWLLPSAGYRLRVEAGTADGGLGFSVSRDGTVRLDRDSAAGGCGVAVGNALTVHGRTITVDGRALSHGLLPVGVPDTGGGGYLPRDRVHRLTLLPATGYGFHAGPGLTADFAYTVRPDGTVDYEESCDAFLSGRGTDRLVVGGFAVALSAARADSDLVGVTALDGTPRTPRELAAVLAPADGYRPRTAHGLCGGFRIGRDGGIAFDPAGARSFVLRPAGSEAYETEPYGTGADVVGTDVAATEPYAAVGQVPLTVRIAPAVTGGPPPRGGVTFSVAGRVLASGLLDEVGLATLCFPDRLTGDHELVVAYEGDEEHAPCTATVLLRGDRPSHAD